MSAVEVEIAKAPPPEGPEDPEAGSTGDAGGSSERQGRKPRERASETSGASADVEREVTKRELIRSVSNILVVVLYMVFTLLRDRDAGVVMVDGDDQDDWED